MKFLDMISRKKAAEPQTMEADDQADPAPLEDVLKAVAQATAEDRDDEGADILDYPGEPDAGSGDAAPRGFLDDDGSYDWDLSELDDGTAEAVPEAEAVAEPQPDDTPPAEDAPALHAETGMDEAAEAQAEDASGDTWDTADTAWEDDGFDDEEDYDEDYDDDGDAVAGFADDMQDSADQPLAAEDAVTAPEMAEDTGSDGADEDQDDGFELASVSAALRAQMPETPKEPAGDGGPGKSTQQALLATIRAAREKAEQVRMASESGASPAPAAAMAPTPEPAPAPAMAWDEDGDDAYDDIEADNLMAPDPVSEEPEPEQVALRHFDEDDAMAGDAEDLPMAEAETPDFSDDVEDVAQDTAEEFAPEPEHEPEPAPAAQGRKIWDMDAGDDDEDDADTAWMAEDEAAAPAEAPAPVQEPVRPAAAALDPAVAMAAMTAPKRRAGRVKTRLLGFNKPAQSDPISQAMEQEPDQAGAPTFPVGWLVVVRGPGRGASFPLGAGASKIGRGDDQPVRLDFGDNSISRDNHAVVAYDDEQRKFYLGHGGKANLVRLNDMPVLSTETLSDGDRIRIGETMLRFVALCGPEFTWAEDEAGSAPHAAAE